MDKINIAKRIVETFPALGYKPSDGTSDAVNEVSKLYFVFQKLSYIQ